VHFRPKPHKHFWWETITQTAVKLYRITPIKCHIPPYIKVSDHVYTRQSDGWDEAV